MRWKLAFYYVALSMVLLFAFQFIVINAIESYHIENRRNEINTEAIIFANYVAGVHGFTNLEQATPRMVLDDSARRRSTALGVRILVVNDYARVIADSNTPSRVGQTLLRTEIIGALRGNDTYVLVQDEYLLNVAVSIHDVGSDRVGAVLMISSVYDIFESIAYIRNMLMLTTLLVGLLGVVFIFIISHHLIAPIKRTVSVVRRMGAGQLSLRVPAKGKDEYSVMAGALNDMAEKLSREDKTREEFVSNVSHEIKTPLAAIKVLSESILLHDTAPEEIYREFMQDINSEVDRMTNITNDLLALVKVDQREQGLNISKIELHDLVEEIMQRLSPLAEQKNIGLFFEATGPVQLNGDEIKLTLAISNIVENGIKYTPSGGTVRATVDADHQSATIIIQDSGIGIPEAEHDKIFNRFYRVDKTRDRETGGTGLGLAISRSTVLLHNGSIRLYSQQDEGSIFTIRLPLRI